MKSRILKLLFSASIAATTLSNASPVMAQNVVINKFPTDYVRSGRTFYDLEGYVVNIANLDTVKIATPKMIEEPVRCDSIHPSTKNTFGTNIRQLCLQQGTSFGGCKSVYQNGPHKPSTYDFNRMVPNQPVQYWVMKQKKANPSKNFVGVNLGFFNTRPLPGRSTNDTLWKPIYQEACGRTLGPYRRAGIDTLTGQWYSKVEDREIISGSTKDQYFGAVALWPADNKLYASLIPFPTATSDLDYNSNSTIIPGVWVRFNGDEFAKENTLVPDFVAEKWDSKVGRTAIGFSTNLKQVRIIVIQPGRNGAGRGTTVADVRDLVGPKSDFPYVMLLDGSGSSQLAATKTVPFAVDITQGRTDCLWATEIKTCSLRGDSVPSAFVSHLSAGYRTVGDPQISGNILVDRPNPTQLILEY